MLGPIVTDYNQLTMSFIKNGHHILLSGEPKPAPEEASLHQLQRLVNTDAIDTLIQLQKIIPTTPSTPSEHSDARINTLLKEYSTLFATPHTLPPPRPIDHKIPLIDNNQIANVRPYRYPHFQKKEIETQIRDMLANGIIQQSSSPFPHRSSLSGKRMALGDFVLIIELLML